MAKYDVTHSCGHIQEHQIVGPGKDRDRRITYLQSTLCTECYRRSDEAKPKGYLRPVQNGVEIFVLDSYAIKDVLKTEGFRFDEYRRPGKVVDLMAPLAKGWGRVFESSEAATAWLDARGKDLGISFTVLHADPVASAFTALAEGRPDLLRAK